MENLTERDIRRRPRTYAHICACALSTHEMATPTGHAVYQIEYSYAVIMCTNGSGIQLSLKCW